MSSLELLRAVYDWLQSHDLWIAAALVLLPLGGTAVAWMAKGRPGDSAAAGKLTASVVIGAAVVLVFVEAAALLLATKVLRRDLWMVMLNGNAILVLGPPLSLAAAVLGLRLVFPLSQLATIRTLRDLALLIGLGWAAIWALGKFRGWGVWFLGGIGDLLLLAGLAVAVLYYLYKRSTGPTPPLRR